MNTRMKVIIGVAFAALIAIAALTISKTQEKTEATEEVRAEANALFTNYTDAVSKAKAQNKMILVDVFTDWCVWCKRMDKDVYTDPAVQAEMNKYFTSVKLDAEATKEQTFRGATGTEQSIAQNMKVTGYPTTVFMTPDEQVIQAIPGYIKAPEFALVLRYIGTKGYETKNFEEWKKTQI
jgi:thioredoxin-related protein